MSPSVQENSAGDNTVFILAKVMSLVTAAEMYWTVSEDDRVEGWTVI